MGVNAERRWQRKGLPFYSGEPSTRRRGGYCTVGRRVDPAIGAKACDVTDRREADTGWVHFEGLRAGWESIKRWFYRKQVQWSNGVVINGRLFDNEYLFMLHDLDEPWRNAKWKEPLNKGLRIVWFLFCCFCFFFLMLVNRHVHRNFKKLAGLREGEMMAIRAGFLLRITIEVFVWAHYRTRNLILQKLS